MAHLQGTRALAGGEAVERAQPRPRTGLASGRTYPVSMRDPAPDEPLWRARLRWRMRGAWQWPTFFALTALEALLLVRLPPYDQGPRNVVAAVLLAGFANLFCVAVLAPLAGRGLRRRRRDLPRPVADNYAGTALLCAGALTVLVAGLAHRPAIAERQADHAAQARAVHDYVVAQAPRYRDGLDRMDAIQLEHRMYRTCVPGPDPKRWLCLFVSTDQDPAGVTLDDDRAPNSVYTGAGGFR